MAFVGVSVDEGCEGEHDRALYGHSVRPAWDGSEAVFGSESRGSVPPVWGGVDIGLVSLLWVWAETAWKTYAVEHEDNSQRQANT